MYILNIGLLLINGKDARNVTVINHFNHYYSDWTRTRFVLTRCPDKMIRNSCNIIWDDFEYNQTSNYPDQLFSREYDATEIWVNKDWNTDLGSLNMINNVNGNNTNGFTYLKLLCEIKPDNIDSERYNSISWSSLQYYFIEIIASIVYSDIDNDINCMNITNEYCPLKYIKYITNNNIIYCNNNNNICNITCNDDNPCINKQMNGLNDNINEMNIHCIGVNCYNSIIYCPYNIDSTCNIYCNSNDTYNCFGTLIMTNNHLKETNIICSNHWACFDFNITTTNINATLDSYSNTSINIEINGYKSYYNYRTVVLIHDSIKAFNLACNNCQNFQH